MNYIKFTTGRRRGESEGDRRQVYQPLRVTRPKDVMSQAYHTTRPPCGDHSHIAALTTPFPSRVLGSTSSYTGKGKTNNCIFSHSSRSFKCWYLVSHFVTVRSGWVAHSKAESPVNMVLNWRLARLCDFVTQAEG